MNEDDVPAGAMVLQSKVFRVNETSSPRARCKLSHVSGQGLLPGEAMVDRSARLVTDRIRRVRPSACRQEGIPVFTTANGAEYRCIATA